VGPFAIGDPIQSIIQYIRNHNKFQLVEMKYNSLDPLCMCICLDIKKEGIDLRFNPTSQRLELIRIYKLTDISLRYNHMSFSSPELPATFSSVHTKFGPTSRGKYTEEKDLYRLTYPGITFVFDVPQKEGPLPDYFEENTSEYGRVPLSCIYVFEGDAIEGEDNPHLVLPQLTPNGPQVNVYSSQGLEFQEIKEVLTFKHTPQDLLTVLGAPDHITYKTSDPLLIHSNRGSEYLYQYDYFYNYLSKGLDILFDATTHKIKKFILHTNYPTHPQFNLYIKCHYKIKPPFKLVEVNNEIKESSSSSGNGNTEEESEEEIFITPEMKWPDIEKIYIDGGEKVNQPFHQPPATDSPFGGSTYYAFKDIIYEVMDNGYVATVTLFKS